MWTSSALPSGSASHTNSPGSCFHFVSGSVIVFNAKSCVKKESFKTADKSFNHSGYLLFGGKGTKVIHCSYNAPVQKDSVLQIFSLNLSPAEEATLKNSYSPPKK